MTSDDTFRWIMIAVMALFAPRAMYRRFRSATDERLDRWQEGAIILFGLRLSGVPMFIGGLAWLVNPRSMDWSSLPLPIWLRWVGVGLIGIAGWLLLWTFRNLGKNLTDTVVTRRDHTLVTSGPYRYVRHPFYVTFAIGMLGASLVMANWFMLLAGMLPFGFLIARTRIEERKLIERFGDDYREYMRRVGRFFPRLH